ncbi:MAG: TolC family protein [Syntrophobacterales bacterium]|nr:TolC family protein [Syntrophobacterales bacterium]
MRLFARFLIALVFIFGSLDGSLGESQKEVSVKKWSLEEAVSEAIRNNSIVQEAMERERAAMWEEKSARADLFPKISFSYEYVRLKEDPYAIFNKMEVGMGPLNNYSWNITLTQPLFTGFALETKRRIAELGIKSKVFDRERAILDVIKMVKVAYFRVLLAEKYLRVAEEQEIQLKAHLEDAKLFYEQGLIPQNDLLKSEVAYARAQQEKVSSESALSVARASFNTILRHPIDEKPELEDVTTLTTDSYNLSSLMEEAFANRPEIRVLNVLLEQAKLGEKLAKSGYYPKVYVFGRYFQQGEDWRATENDYQNSHNASVGLQVNWPFLESGKTRADSARALHERLAVAEKMKGLRDSIGLEVKEALEKLNVARRNITTAEKALSQAKENYRITNLQYQQQITTSTEVLDAQTYLTQAQVNYYNALYGYYTTKAELERAVGRGLPQGNP